MSRCWINQSPRACRSYELLQAPGFTATHPLGSLQPLIYCRVHLSPRQRIYFLSPLQLPCLFSLVFFRYPWESLWCPNWWSGSPVSLCQEHQSPHACRSYEPLQAPGFSDPPHLGFPQPLLNCCMHLPP